LPKWRSRKKEQWLISISNGNASPATSRRLSDEEKALFQAHTERRRERCIRLRKVSFFAEQHQVEGFFEIFDTWVERWGKEGASDMTVSAMCAAEARYRDMIEAKVRKKRGHRIDEDATLEMQFKDPRSWVHRDGRVFRAGEDMTELREACFDRSRGKCEMKVEGGHRCYRLIAWSTFEMHHDPPRSKGGSDELSKVVASCKDCHRKAQRWTEPRAEKQFLALTEEKG